MKKIVACLLIIIMTFSMFTLCSCEKKAVRTDTSVLTTFAINGVEKAEKVMITIKNKDTGDSYKVELTPGEESFLDLEPGVYTVKSVKADTERIVLSVDKTFFNVAKANKMITFAVESEYERPFLEWFLYNNAFYLTCLVGCAIFLGVNTVMKKKKLQENRE